MAALIAFNIWKSLCNIVTERLDDSSSKEPLLELEELGAECDESKPLPPHTQSSASLFNVFSVLVCISCATLSWYFSFSRPISFYDSSSATSNYRTVHRSKYNSLRRPSPFIGFDYLPRSKPRRLVNFPMSISLVNASNVDQTFSDDPGLEWTETGLISREDRTVMISPSVSTIVQFRAVDYGMERCILTIRISSTTTDVLDFPRKVSIHRLDASHGPLNLKTLSYSNRPTRIFTVGNMQVSPDNLSDWQAEFHCLWDTVHIFEIGYTGQGIDEYRDHGTFTIQWSQNKENVNPETGVFLVQRESI